MSDRAKISPAFEPFLAESGPNDKRDAIVVFQTPKVKSVRDRGRSHTLRERLDQIKVEQQSLQSKVVAEYNAATDQNLEMTPVGSGALPVRTVEVTRKSLPALAQQPEVVAILPNQEIQLIQPKQVEFGNLQRQEIKDGLTWGLKQLGIPELWNETRGAGINVAVLDTGVYGPHLALEGRVRAFVLIDPLGRRIETTEAFDSDQHGTHVCGTIAGGESSSGVSIGVAPEANLLVAAVLIGQATLHTLFEGISWAIENEADIINMSLGFSYYEPLFAEVIDMLIDQFGILPVVAIGNENHGNSSSPGNAPNAFSVGAVEKMARGKLEVAFFSSGASLVFPGDEPDALVTKPDVVAPGVQVLSCIPPEKKADGLHEYAYMSGTSMATPHVSGVAALLMAAHPRAPVADIVTVLKETAMHPGGEQRRPDNRWGYGLIRPLEALNALG